MEICLIICLAISCPQKAPNFGQEHFSDPDLAKGQLILKFYFLVSSKNEQKQFELVAQLFELK